MTKKIFAAVLLFVFSIQYSAVRADDVVRLTPVAGTASEYSVAELLRVELNGDFIRFIGTDGTLVAEVYKYDYVQLTIADTETTGVEQTCQTKDNRQKTKEECRKLIKNGQVYILFGDKLNNISGNKIK